MFSCISQKKAYRILQINAFGGSRQWTMVTAAIWRFNYDVSGRRSANNILFHCQRNWWWFGTKPGQNKTRQFRHIERKVVWNLLWNCVERVSDEFQYFAAYCSLNLIWCTLTDWMRASQLGTELCLCRNTTEMFSNGKRVWLHVCVHYSLNAWLHFVCVCLRSLLTVWWIDLNGSPQLYSTMPLKWSIVVN